MILYITLPILISNIIAITIALWKIYQNYKNTILKPRLLLIILLIIADFPGSVLTVLTAFINSNILSNKYLCYFYMSLNFTWTIKVFSLICLTLLVSFIVFANYSIHKLTTIGYIMNFQILLSFLFVEFILLPLAGARPKHDFEIQGNNFFRHCGAKIKWIDNGFFIFQFYTSLLTVLAAVILYIYSILYKKFKKGNSFKRIFASFICFSFINSMAMFQYFVEDIICVKITKHTRYVLLDCEKIVPTLFSVSYILLESFSNTTKINFNIRKVLINDNARALFKNYLKTIGQRIQYETLNLWETIERCESITYTIFGQNDLTKRQALNLIEKRLELDVDGFFMTESFNDFFYVYKRSGRIEVDLVSEMTGNATLGV